MRGVLAVTVRIAITCIGIMIALCSGTSGGSTSTRTVYILCRQGSTNHGICYVFILNSRYFLGF